MNINKNTIKHKNINKNTIKNMNINRNTITSIVKNCYVSDLNSKELFCVGPQQ